MTNSDKRRRILDAAVSVFAQNGFYNSKVSQVAREAGVADGTIYLYFKNKEDLLIQVFLDTMEHIIEQQEVAMLDSDSPAERLKSFIRVHFEFVAKSAALAEVITVELRQSSKFMRATDMKPFGRYLSMIARIIAEGQQDGVFQTTVEPRRVARAIFGVLDEFALEWAMDERRAPIEEGYQHIVNLFLNGLVTRPISLKS